MKRQAITFDILMVLKIVFNKNINIQFIRL